MQTLNRVLFLGAVILATGAFAVGDAAPGASARPGLLLEQPLGLEIAEQGNRALIRLREEAREAALLEAPLLEPYAMAIAQGE